MRNFKRIALATTLTFTGSGGMVQAAELGEQQKPQNVEYLMSYEGALGSVAMQRSLGNAELIENSTVSQIDVSQLFDEIQPVVATEKAVRTGNMVQLREPTPPPIVEQVVVPNYFNWLRLADCESGGDWSINTGNGFDGGLQFTPTSWKGAGGLQFAPRAYLATPEQQMLTAEVLLDLQGWDAWPGCSRKLRLG